MEMLRETIVRSKKDVFEFRLIKRNDHVAMYAQYYMDTDVPRIVSYEVFLIRKQEASVRVIPGHGEIEYHPKELYPKDEDFGYTAWSISDVNRADAKFEELTGRAYEKASISVN